MKTKSKITMRSEFRRNKVTQHPSFIFASQGNKFKHIGLTHSATTKDPKTKKEEANIRLHKNPDPKDTSTAFVRPKAETTSSNKFSKKLIGWRFSKKDKETINKITK